jgi:Xaa-Pro aminopeptidase
MNYAKRTALIQEGLSKTCAFYVSSPADVFYLSGFSGTFGKIVLTPSKRIFLTDKRYEESVRKSEIASLFEIEIIKGLKQTLLKLLHGKKRVMLTETTPLGEYLLVINEVKGCTAEISHAVRELRAVKDKDELDLIRKSVKIAEASFKYLFSILKPGMTEKEAGLAFEFFARSKGAESLSFTPIIAFGANSSVPHHATGTTKLKKGMVVLADAGVKYRGYCSDLTRVGAFCIMHSHLKKVQNIYNIARKAKEIAVNALRNSAECRLIDQKAREYLKEHGGLDANFTHSLGHSLGIEIHEPPFLAPRETAVLKAGCTVTVEPGLYFPGEFGVRIEDDYAVTKYGAEKLGTMNDSLVIL